MRLKTELSMDTLNQSLLVASMDAAFKVELQNIIRAAALVVIDPRLKAHMVANDPQALHQIIESIEAFAGDYVTL